jgi:hypothetical protein
MALYTNELAAEAMRERARTEIERAKRMANMQQERSRQRFREETSAPPEGASMDRHVLESLSRAELYAHAKRIGVVGRGKMSKAELAEALRHVW